MLRDVAWRGVTPHEVIPAHAGGSETPQECFYCREPSTGAAANRAAIRALQPMNNANNTVAPLRLIRMKQVMAMTGLARCTIYRDMARGSFPKPVKIGTAICWPAHEVEAFIAQRIAERDGANPAAEANAA
jgi:prophage regulatory protein